ncbi:hypothetical protein L195_g017948, partial [Trifolium pratense]
GSGSFCYDDGGYDGVLHSIYGVLVLGGVLFFSSPYFYHGSLLVSDDGFDTGCPSGGPRRVLLLYSSGVLLCANIDALMVVGHNDLLCVGSFAGSDLVLLSSVLIVVDVWLWSKEECHNSKVRLSFNRTTAAESFFLSPKHFLQRSLWCFVFGFWTLMFSEIVLMLLFAFWFVVAAFALQSDCGSLLSGFGFDIRLSLGCGAQWSPPYRLFWLFFLASVGVLGLVCFCFAFDGFIT